MTQNDPSDKTEPKTRLGLESNVAGALCYVLGFISGIFFLVTEKNNTFIRFHAWQSIAVTVVWTVLSMFVSLIPLFGGFLNGICGLIGFILWAFLMYKAYSKEEFEMPFVGDFAKRQAHKSV